ncbi:hypothetical protein chumba_68 [Pseudomonas phage chumba]|uniref:Uncharacterized protein n=1 Tax=Pseudomonas phage vB_PaeM_FBPa33 TaxID=3231236 RepID=A0AAU8KTZ1_9VIRU|nr:hypothetical protein chumba_68 [Pseudomonas phage chumba]
MNNKPTLNHHHQTALLYLYNNPNQPPFTGPNNKALNELRQIGYVKAQEFENWAGTGRIRAEWMLTKAGIDFVENEILRKCAACTGIGQTLLRGKCTICNGSGQVWISDEPQRHFEDCPQCAPKLEKTDANRLAEQLETIARLEKELEESEKRGSELAASYCDGVVGDEYGHTYCRYKAERDAALAEVERLREENANLILACASLDSEKREIQHKWDAIIAMRGDALARVAELEMKLDKADYAYDNDRIHMRGLAARAIARAKVFDDGSDGADAESARSVVAILRELLAVGGASAQHSAPDGYAMIPVRETEAMHDAVMALLYNGVARTDTQKLLDAYINAATNKESV